MSNVSVDPNWPSSKFHAKLGSALMPVIVDALNDLEWSECEPVLNLACAYLKDLAKRYGDDIFALNSGGKVEVSICDENGDEELLFVTTPSIKNMAASMLKQINKDAPNEVESERAILIRSLEEALAVARTYKPGQ